MYYSVVFTVKFRAVFEISGTGSYFDKNWRTVLLNGVCILYIHVFTVPIIIFIRY